jgi:hypothetical protein
MMLVLITHKMIFDVKKITNSEVILKNDVNRI